MKLSKTTISKTTYFLLALLVAFSFSCNPEDGEDGIDGQDGIGLTGPAGTNGEDGADGTDGTNGEDGEDGNANVIASAWVDASYTAITSFRRTFILTAPEITQDAMDSSAIFVYGRANGSEVWALAVNFPFVGHSFSYACNSVGEINIYCDSIDSFGSLGSPYLSEFRYVIIPASTSGKSAVDYSKMSYEEAIDILGLDY